MLPLVTGIVSLLHKRSSRDRFVPPNHIFKELALKKTIFKGGYLAYLKQVIKTKFLIFFLQINLILV